MGGGGAGLSSQLAIPKGWLFNTGLTVFRFKRSGTEEELTELQQLCEDIITYRRDIAELRKTEKEAKKKKEEDERQKAEEMRKAAVERLAS